MALGYNITRTLPPCKFPSTKVGHQINDTQAENNNKANENNQQSRFDSAMEATWKAHECCSFEWNCTLFQGELTKEIGGRFFLNFALIAPMLPCALVTYATSWQPSVTEVQPLLCEPAPSQI